MLKASFESFDLSIVDQSALAIIFSNFFMFLMLLSLNRYVLLFDEQLKLSKEILNNR